MAISFVQWFDSDYGAEELLKQTDKPEHVEWVRCIPFVILHLGCFAAFWTGWSWTSVAIAAGLYFIRMFAVTGIHHRYGFRIWIVRTAIEVTVLLIGWLLGGNVGVGTVAFALLVGPLVNLTMPLLKVPAARVTPALVTS